MARSFEGKGRRWSLPVGGEVSLFSMALLLHCLFLIGIITAFIPYLHNQSYQLS
jgi:hypothetical protein